MSEKILYKTVGQTVITNLRYNSKTPVKRVVDILTSANNGEPIFFLFYYRDLNINLQNIAFVVCV